MKTYNHLHIKQLFCTPQYTNTSILMYDFIIRLILLTLLVHISTQLTPRQDGTLLLKWNIASAEDAGGGSPDKTFKIIARITLS